jgi:hypothetical protein
MSRAEVEAARQAGLIVEEPPLGFFLRSKPSATEAVSEAANPAQEQSKVSQTPAIPSGIETPRGPITRSQNPPSQGQQEFFKPRLGQTPKQGIGL